MVFASILAPFSIRYFTTSNLPSWIEINRGVVPVFSFSSTLAPFSIRYFTTSSHSRQYSKLRKSVRVIQSQNVPLSCLSRPLADRLAEAAYRDILGLSYARAFPQLGVLPAVKRRRVKIFLETNIKATAGSTPS